MRLLHQAALSHQLKAYLHSESKIPYEDGYKTCFKARLYQALASPLKSLFLTLRAAWQRLVSYPARSLSAKVLLLTILFVMLAEVLIFVPSVANFRKNWLNERLGAAQIAAIAAQSGPVPKALEEKLLINARVHAVAIKMNGTRKLVLWPKKAPGPMAYYDLSKATLLGDLIPNALSAFFSTRDRLIRVSGKPNMIDGSMVEIVVGEKPLISAMHRYALTILLLSLIIASIAATLIFLSLNRILIKPMKDITHNIVTFSENPEDHSRFITLSGRQDEVGRTEKSLLSLEQELATMLQQKSRLASLGLAVSKINHDLRNMLSSAQLISDHLGTVDNPTVQRMTPRLINSLDRAIRLCGNTLKYGKSTEISPERRPFPLLPLVNEVIESLGIENNGIIFKKTIDHSLTLNADRDHIFRVISNLTRNAALALKAEQEQDDFSTDKEPKIFIRASQSKEFTKIYIEDNGLGIPDTMKDDLFKAFQTTTRVEGTGLGLAISDELIRAHGGEIALQDGTELTSFVITLPV